ncbi:MAG TPA: DUF4384 domain-containing protein, partial [Pyrinomonadaceae bacterium]
GGVAAWLLLRNRSGATANANNANSNTGNSNSGTTANTNNSNTGGTTAREQETLDYWLEVAEAGPNGDSARVAGTVPLASGQSFKFHFTPRQNGYLYIIGPGEDGKPMTFLTAEPVEDSGVESNEVESGVEFAFPEDEEEAQHWITLDKKAGTESYTVIFSQTQLTAPSFLSEEAGHELTADEQKELEDFRAKYKANAPTTDVINGGGTDPLVSVKVSQAAKSEPVVFDVRIEHK